MPSTASRVATHLGKVAHSIESAILTSRYLLVPLFLALLFRILTIIEDFYRVLIGQVQAEALNEHTLIVLQLLDITMVANLIWLISAGSYYVFIDRSIEEETSSVPYTHLFGYPEREDGGVANRSRFGASASSVPSHG